MNLVSSVLPHHETADGSHASSPALSDGEDGDAPGASSAQRGTFQPQRQDFATLSGEDEGMWSGLEHSAFSLTLQDAHQLTRPWDLAPLLRHLWVAMCQLPPQARG